MSTSEICIPMSDSRLGTLVINKHSQSLPNIMTDDWSEEKRKSQIYYWATDWQKGEKAADKDIEAGRTKKFSNAKDAIKYLRS